MFDDFLKKLRDFQRRAEQLHGEHQVPLSELFPEEFMLLNTDYTSFGDMIDGSGYAVASPEDFAAIPDEVWDAHVQAHTRFSSWKEMQSAAAQEWAAKQLGFE